MNRGNSTGMAEPPEGALVGENVPIENDRHEADRSKINMVKNTLKADQPYKSMADDVVEQIAEKIVEGGGSL